VAFSCARPGTPVLKRGDGVLEAREAIHGAYVSSRSAKTESRKKCSHQRRQVMHNVKIVAVTSPQLYEELRRSDPAKAAAILSDEERQSVVPCTTDAGISVPICYVGDYQSRVFGLDRFPDPGSRRIYGNAGFDCEGLRKKILSGSTSGAGTNRRL